MSMDNFMSKFGGHNPGPKQPPVIKSGTPFKQVTKADLELPSVQETWKCVKTICDGFSGMSSFMEKFSGLSQPFHFYYVDGKPTVTLRFDKEAHIYYRVLENGTLEPQKGVTTVCHIIDKSKALVPWAAKMTAEKMMRLMPTVTGPNGEILTKQMRLSDFSVMVGEAKNAHKERLEEAGDVGHMAHACLEASIVWAIAMTDGVVTQLRQEPTEMRALNCCNNAHGWMKAHNVRWLQTEKKVYSKKYKFAGTMDGLCTVDSCTDRLCCLVPFKDALTVADWKSSNYLYIEYLYQTAAYEQAHEEEHGVDVTDRWILRLGKSDGDFEPWHLTAPDFAQDFLAFVKCLELVLAHEEVEERMRLAKKAKTAARRAAKLVAKELAKEQERLAKALAKAQKKEAKEAAALAAKELKAAARKEKLEKQAAERIAKSAAKGNKNVD